MSTGGGFFEFREKMAAAKIAKPQAAVVPASPMTVSELTGKIERTLSGHKGWIYSLAFAPDGARLASASYDDTVRLWRLDAKEEPLVLLGHRDAVKPTLTALVSVSSAETKPTPRGAWADTATPLTLPPPPRLTPACPAICSCAARLLS